MTYNTSPRKPAPDMIRLAIMAAGGYDEVAAEFGVTHWAIHEWARSSRVPLKRIRRLCEMGGVITPNQILEQIEAAIAEKVAA
jgi:hypothetical protein